jgi:hypothetical protein
MSPRIEHWPAHIGNGILSHRACSVWTSIYVKVKRFQRGSKMLPEGYRIAWMR